MNKHRTVRRLGLGVALAVTCALLGSPAVAQADPADARPLLRPELAQLQCPPRRVDERPPASEAERLEREARARYRELLPLYYAQLPAEPDPALMIPVEGVSVRQVTNTFGAPRSGGRVHEGQDIFAPRGTPVRAATAGIVWRISERERGGLSVTVVGAGGRRYYYAHLDRYAEDIHEGDYVTRGTVLGYVGNSGNAAGTPPHLHFSVYTDLCDWTALDPLPLLVDE